jgi:hypothetical protein
MLIAISTFTRFLLIVISIFDRSSGKDMTPEIIESMQMTKCLVI